MLPPVPHPESEPTMEESENIKAIMRSSEPLLQTWTQLGSTYAQKVVTTGFTAARDVHDEWKARVKDVFDTVDNTQQGLSSLVRRLSGHLDTLISDTLSMSEKGVLSLVGAVSSTADDAATIAARTGSAWVGSKEKAA
ncbi:MAG: hypothetical protein AAGF11_23095 [Myxococcota bacterium]